MSRDKSFFEIPPPPELDQKIERAASEALAENRRAFQRRRFMQWFLVPAFSVAAVSLVFKFWRQEGADLEVAEFLDWNEMSEDDLEIVMDMDLLEDLEILENWEES